MDSKVQPRNRPSPRRGIGIAAALAGAIGLITAVLVFGNAVSHGVTASTGFPYPPLLVALPVILAACHLAGMASRRLGQPAVIGEIIAGVLLGPSLLGLVWPAVSRQLFPSDVVATINTLAQLGLILFMYLVGAKINLGTVRSRRVTVMAVSQASIAIPMLSGLVLAFALYPPFGARPDSSPSPCSRPFS